MDVLVPILSESIAFIGVLSIASMVLITTSYVGNNKVFYQTFIFGSLFAASVAYLYLSSPTQLASFWKEYTSLSNTTKVALAIIVVTSTYFGGAMYLAPPEQQEIGADQLLTPASCDTNTTIQYPSELPEDDQALFEDMFEGLRAMIIRDISSLYEMPDEAVKWLDRMIDYTVAGGKMNRGLAMMSAYKTLLNSKGTNLTIKGRCQSAALGWCIEFLQAFFLVADDVMDHSVTRRGAPCWFRNNDVQLIAINDSFILESCVFKILKRYFGQELYYPQLVDLFIEVTRQTELGQLLDLTSQPLDGVIDLSRFTLERYISIVKYKTAFYSFYLPVALAMIMAGVKDPEQYALARKILLIMGEYFQIQDDYLDCYGAPEVIGKIGTDIQDKKCSWLVVQALSKATASQRAVLENNYGQNDAQKVAAVKQLYAELQLEEVFQQYEEQSYLEIKNLLNDVRDMPTEVFEFLLRKIYKRAK